MSDALDIAHTLNAVTGALIRTIDEKDLRIARLRGGVSALGVALRYAPSEASAAYLTKCLNRAKYKLKKAHQS